LRLVAERVYCADMARRNDPENFVEPCIPTLTAKPPSGPGRVYEIKHIG
jgi:hypothetical protein